MLGEGSKMKEEIQLKNNILILKKKLAKDDTYRINERKGIFTLTIFKKPQWTKGVTSYCNDGKHILYLDFDGICRWIVEKELEILAEKYSPFYMFYTKEKEKDGEIVGNYHAISLEKFWPAEIVDIQRTTSCDNAYTTMPLRNIFRSWVLRQADKKGSGRPQFIKVIGKKNLYKGISKSHLMFLEKVYKIPKIDYKNLDNSTKIYFNEYETAP